MIRFDSVSKKYRGGSRPALDSIDLEILGGEFVFLVGASGSGKSSCLRLILKEERPSSGKIHVLGQDLGKISSRKVPYFRRNIGVVFQDFRLLPNKSVFDNVAFSLQVIGKSKGFIQEAVPDTLTMVGLAGKANRLPHELSGGEQQRVAIARAVVNKPAVLLADEPTGNLDPTTSAGIMALLERINAAGTTVVMATHEAGIVDQMKRRVIELSAGSIIRDESEGGYGQTQAVPIMVDGFMIVAADDDLNATGSQPRVPTATPSVAPAAPAAGPSATAAPAVVAPTAASVSSAAAAGSAAPVASASVAQPQTAVPVGAPAPTAAPVASPAPIIDEPISAQEVADVDLRASVPASASTPGAVAPVEPAQFAPVSAASAAAQPDEASVLDALPTEEVDHSLDEAAPPVTTPDGGAPDIAVAPIAPVTTGHHIETQTGTIYLPTGDEHLPEQLSLAERLGLRAPEGRGDDEGEQNVGPTK